MDATKNPDGPVHDSRFGASAAQSAGANLSGKGLGAAPNAKLDLSSCFVIVIDDEPLLALLGFEAAKSCRAKGGAVVFTGQWTGPEKTAEALASMFSVEANNGYSHLVLISDRTMQFKTSSASENGNIVQTLGAVLGDEVIEALKKLNPNIKCILNTGDKMDIEEILAARGKYIDAYLLKPNGSAALLQKVGEVCNISGTLV